MAGLSCQAASPPVVQFVGRYQRKLRVSQIVNPRMMQRLGGLAARGTSCVQHGAQRMLAQRGAACTPGAIIAQTSKNNTHKQAMNSTH